MPESLKRTRIPAENHDALPFDLQNMPDFLRRRAKEELFEDDETRVSSLRLLKSLLREERNLDWQDDDSFLLSFLRCRKFDVRRALALVKNFYAVMEKHDEIYEDFDYALVEKTLKANSLGFLPYRDQEGCVVLVIYTARWNPNENSLGAIMRALSSALLHAGRSPATQVAGYKVIFDLKGLSLRHLPHVTPSYLWLFAEALQNSFPGRFRAVHMVNEGHLFSSIWSVIKPLLSKKIRERFLFHGRDTSKLHKYFSPSILPKEYGGELPPFDNAAWAKQMAACSDDISRVFSYGYRTSAEAN